MMYRNGIYYDKMVRNGITYDRMVRNGVVYGETAPDPDAAAYIAAVETADGEPLEDIVKDAINAFVKGCKLDASPNPGISNWEAIKTGALMCVGRTLNSCFVTLKGDSTPTNVAFISDDYTRFLGLKGNGGAKYIETGRNVSAEPQNNKHLSVYFTEPVPSPGVTQCFLGASSGTGNSELLATASGVNLALAYFRINNGGGAGSDNINLSGSSLLGFYGASRHLSTENNIYYNNTAGTLTKGSAAPATNQYRVFRRAGDGSVATMSYYSIGEAVDLTLMAARLNILMDTLGSITPVEEEWILNVNFSHVGRSDDEAVGWNTVRFPTGEFNPTGISFSNLQDDNAVPRDIGIEIISVVDTIATADITSIETFPIPEFYAVTLYGGPGLPTASFRITGLNPSALYDLRFKNFIDSGTDTRVTINSITVNPIYAYPTTTDFDDSAYISFNDLSPNSSGEIEFDVDSFGQSFWALLGFRLRQQGTPEPELFRMVAVDDPSNESGYGFAENLPVDYESKSDLPLLIFMHGSGEIGSGSLEDLELLKNWGIPKLCANGTWNPGHDFVMLAPQSPTNGYFDGSDKELLNDFITWAKTTYKIDTGRIYMTGLSMGGWDTFSYLGIYGAGSQIAAAVPLSAFLPIVTGTDFYGTFAVAAESNVPIWDFVNLNDPSVPFDTPGEYGCVTDTVNGINALNTGQVKLTVFNQSSHDSLWDPIYSGGWQGTEMGEYDAYDETIYDWLLSYQSSG